MKTADLTDTKTDHARQNAANWFEEICRMVANLTLEGAAQAHANRLTRDECLALLPADTDTEHLGSDMSEEDQLEELRALVTAGIVDSSIEFEHDDDAARDEILESVLSVEIRSGWTALDDELTAEEFMILLSTGGPALRLRGELDRYSEPSRAWLEYQDWGTGWTQYFEAGTQYFEADSETLLAFARVFCFEHA